MKTNSIRPIIGRITLTALYLGAAMLAAAQDYKGLKGDNSKTGKNDNPAISGPGIANLNWWRPDINDNTGKTLVRDNLSPTQFSVVGGWVSPKITDEANFVYFPNSGDIDLDLLQPTPETQDYAGYNQYQRELANNIQSTAYWWAQTIPSAVGNDPTIKQNAGDTLRTATWLVQPANAIDRIARSYALYAWIPIGPTFDQGAGILRYSQRYYVFEVLYGNSQRFVDVIDTYRSGTGWVRLGNNETSSGQLFDYNGATPITVRLYNTVPRDAFGILRDVPYSTVVYADAIRAVSDSGTYASSPIVSSLNPALAAAPIRVVAAQNLLSSATRDNQNVVITKGEVTAYANDTGVRIWKFSPATASGSDLNLDVDNNAASVTRGALWNNSTTAANFQGADYLNAAIETTDPFAVSPTTYAPTLEDGSYEIQAWLPGSSNGDNFGRAVRYQIAEGATVTDVDVDQDAGGGWVKIGTRRFTHDSVNARLRVIVTNYSSNAADAGRNAYADTIRFVGVSNLAITSTPWQGVASVNVNGTLADRPVVVVCAENGRIYCLDATGNGNGTTNVLWTYPSTPDANVTDPNSVPGEDGGVAEMPTGFGLSSPLVERVNGADFLYVGSSNGRVYCIEMAGRGDQNFGTGKPGTTRRSWSYPDDYPSPARTSSLGPFIGSVAFTTNAAGPTIIAPASQGRVYALGAAAIAGKRTVLRWAYPATNNPTLGTIEMTPAVDFGKVFVGSRSKQGQNYGRFMALNVNTGAQLWEYSGTTNYTADDFVAGPATASDVLLGGGNPNMVYAANEDRNIVGLNADTGAELWKTNELNTQVTGSLTVTPMNVFVSTGGRQVHPVVMVPTVDGRFDGLFASPGNALDAVNKFGTKRAYEYVAAGDRVDATIGVGRGWMYGADSSGVLYAWGNNAGTISPGPAPGSQTIVENDASADIFRDLRIKFVTADAYKKLRQPDGQNLTYAQATSAAYDIGPRSAFEWGETIYVLAYRFPHVTRNTANVVVPAPIVNYAMSVEGASIRNVSIESRAFKTAAGEPISPVDNVTHLNGYSVLAFTLQGNGVNALPPGKARVQVSLNTSSLSNPPRGQQIAPDPRFSFLDFNIANPLALVMRYVTNLPDMARSIGYSVNPQDPQNLVNGSPNVAGTAEDESLLTASPGAIAHSRAGNVTIGVVDRSMMTLLRGPGRGIDNIRASRSDLAWQGGAAKVQKPIPLITFPGFEDVPNQYPNVSLDYPDIRREQISIVKDLFGVAENPLYNAVSLTPPVTPDDNPLNRTLVSTSLDLTVSVPLYQPPNDSTALDSAGGSVDAGYYAPMDVFVDSDSDGRRTRGGGRREAFRAYFLSNSVTKDERLEVITPNVNLGSLGQGEGYDTRNPWQNGTSYSPFGGAYQATFKNFITRNPGNVNLLNLHVAKAYNDGAVRPWELFAPTLHERSWLDGLYHIHSDIDSQFQFTPQVILQKPRVGDALPTELSVNPVRRENQNLGVASGAWDPGRLDLVRAPSIGVSIPIGTPVGDFAQTMRVIEDYGNDQVLPLDGQGNGLDPYSDPTFILNFHVREGRLTNNFTNFTAPMIDNPAVLGSGGNFQHKNSQPTVVRDLAGNLTVGFVSNRAAFTSPQPLTLDTNDQNRIYVAQLRGSTPGGGLGSSFLSDLNAWVPNSGNQWFAQQVGPYPTQPLDTLFASVAGEAVIPSTAKFQNPAFPSLGFTNPFTNATTSSAYMAFVGNAQKQTGSGRVDDSRIFIAPYNSAGLGAPVALTADPQVRKSDPAVVQVGNDATVFYTLGGTGASQINYARFENGAWGPSSRLDFGIGYDWVSQPSVFPRIYQGAGTNPSAGDAIIDIAFTGKLRGRPSADIFLGRLLADGNGTPRNLAYFPRRTQEVLEYTGEVGTYRTRGVLWNTNDNLLKLEQVIGSVVTDLEVPNTRQFDRNTGIISFDTQLGGKAYLDTTVGKVRFTNGSPSSSATLLLTYQTRVLRITPGGNVGTHSYPSLLVDDRLIGEFSYWARSTNAGIAPNDPVRAARYVLTYGRAASGSGQTSRPYMQSLRFAVQLPKAIHTQANGAVTNIQVTGATSFYQVDPANGRVYFTAADEDRQVTVNYTGADESSGQPIAGLTYTGVVGLKTERSEAPVPIEQAINESEMRTFLDPFDNLNATQRRPGLIWMIWTSTRASGPDLYFQTIAPRFTPLSGNRN